ncbi:MAG: CBS domain-containing protein [Anaerolineaceae bacterium]|jgi:acetoin utilization protein AcuB|nr:CBS domain-containing protein [Anaerolineaceae bacterium]
MLVRERMTSPVLTITPEVPVQDALARMHSDKVRRYPVVDKHGKLLGIVTEGDLLNAKPSEATTLSVWEINYYLSKITVERVMAEKVITVTEDCPIEEAARIMADNEISSLPVMRGKSLVGMITETDLFHILLEMMGGRTPGIRLTVEVLNKRGKLYEIAGIIQKLGGDILGVAAVLGKRAETRIFTLKVDGIKLEDLRKAIEPVVEQVIDIREADVK